MVQQVSLEKYEKIVMRPVASVIPMRSTREKNSQAHGKESTEPAPKDTPLFYVKPIFKAKEHDPL
jgi:hypothetical protein